MTDHFSPRTLIFYACAIGSVVTLFTIATAYGEKNLKAAQPIDGRYPLETQTLPGCSPQDFYLLIQQSGVFLTGSLVPKDASEQTVRIAQDRPSLTGRWHNPQLTLTGDFGRGSTCQGTVNIAGTIAEDRLNGTLRIGTAPTAIDLSANREPPPPKTEKH